MLWRSLHKLFYYKIQRPLLTERQRLFQDSRKTALWMDWEEQEIAENIRDPSIERIKLSFCTTCKGRLHHLMQTLPRNLEDNADYPAVEFCVLDYSSEDGLRDWIAKAMSTHLQSGRLRYFYAEDQPVFRMSHAKNCVHRKASGQLLCNLDADNFTGRDYAFYLNYLYSKMGIKCAQGRPNGQLEGHWCGRIIIDRQLFHDVRGYNELLVGWGYDDLDLLERVRSQGHETYPIPYQQFAKGLMHSDQERTLNLDGAEDGLRQSNEANRRKSMETGMKWCGIAEDQGWGEARITEPFAPCA